MNTKNKEIVANFIEEIWNQNQFDRLDSYIHPAFTDHSLPPAIPPDVNGLKLWVIGTGKSFQHTTIIEDTIGDADMVVTRIKMSLKHIGEWRGFKPAGKDILTTGYRCFKLKEDKIIDHWGLIDATAIENQINNSDHACKIEN